MDPQKPIFLTAQARALVFLKPVDICVGRLKWLLLSKVPSSWRFFLCRCSYNSLSMIT